MTLRTSLALGLALLAACPALGAESGGCGAFKWPIEADVALLANAGRVESGVSVPAAAPSGMRVTLLDGDAVTFELPPERQPAPMAPGGVVRFEAARAGVYQITLSEPAWTDVVQNGAMLKPVAFSGVKDCEGARKSLRYELKAGPATIQISNAPGRSIGLAITPPLN